MKPKEVFGIIVRTAGLISLLYLLMSSMAFGMFERSFVVVLYYLAWLAISIWLLRGARLLVAFAYKDEE